MTLDYFYGQAGELFSFYRIPKALFQEPRFQNLSTDAKTLYGILLDRMSLSAKNGWLDEQGLVFIIFTIEDKRKSPRILTLSWGGVLGGFFSLCSSDPVLRANLHTAAALHLWSGTRS